MALKHWSFRGLLLGLLWACSESLVIDMGFTRQWCCGHGGTVKCSTFMRVEASEAPPQWDSGEECLGKVTVVSGGFGCPNRVEEAVCIRRSSFPAWTTPTGKSVPNLCRGCATKALEDQRAADAAATAAAQPSSFGTAASAVSGAAAAVARGTTRVGKRCVAAANSINATSQGVALALGMAVVSALHGSQLADARAALDATQAAEASMFNGTSPLLPLAKRNRRDNSNTQARAGGSSVTGVTFNGSTDTFAVMHPKAKVLVSVPALPTVELARGNPKRAAKLLASGNYDDPTDQLSNKPDSPTAVLSMRQVISLMREGSTDGSSRLAMDADLRASMPIGQQITVKPAVGAFLKEVQQSLMEWTESASAVSSLGAAAVQQWLGRLRHSQPLWSSFLAMCSEIGVNELEQYICLTDKAPAHMVLRRLMQLLVTKYLHANITGLLHHTKLLSAKDTADAQALREERKAEAAQAMKALKAAAKARQDSAAGNAAGPALPTHDWAQDPVLQVLLQQTVPLAVPPPPLPAPSPPVPPPMGVGGDAGAADAGPSAGRSPAQKRGKGTASGKKGPGRAGKGRGTRKR